MKIFYTYLWLREDGTPYYAGKGHGARAFHVHRRGRLKPPMNPENVLLQEWLSEQDAFVGEKLLIAIYGRKDLGTGCLVNMTDGGEGVEGRRYKHTEEQKRNISQALQGNRNVRGCRWRLSADTRAKLSRPFSATHKANISAAALARWARHRARFAT